MKNKKIPISHSNYEAFLIDYLDGNLNPTEIAQLHEFIINNPELNIQLNDLPESQLPFTTNTLNSQLDNLETLKFKPTKNINQTNYEQFIINNIENQLNSEQNSELEFFISQNPIVNNELKAFKATKLKPNTSIVYPDKNALKRTKTITLWNSQTIIRWAVAAVILAFVSFGISLFFNQKTNCVEINIAEKAQPKSQNTSKDDVTLTNKKSNEQLNTNQSAKNQETITKSTQQTKVLTAPKAKEPLLAKLSTVNKMPINKRYNIPSGTNTHTAQLAISENRTFIPQINQPDAQFAQHTQPASSGFLSPKEWITQRIFGKPQAEDNIQSDLFLAKAARASNNLLNTNIVVKEFVNQQGNEFIALYVGNFEFERPTRK